MAYPRVKRSKAHKSVRGAKAGNHSVTSTSFADVDAQYSISLKECQVGDVVEVSFEFSWAHGSAGALLHMIPNFAGTGDITDRACVDGASVANNPVEKLFVWRRTLVSGDISSGTITVKPRAKVSAGTATIYNESTDNRAPLFTVANVGPVQG